MRGRRAQGFTLLEMVVAFAILVTTLLALYASYTGALTRSRQDAHLNDGVLLAQSLITRAGAEWALTDGNRSGRWQEFTYEVSAESTADDASLPFTIPTVKVTARVTWDSTTGRRGISLSTLQFAVKP